MHIDFESSGGFANLQLSYRADTETLPPKQAEELLKLVKSSGVFDVQQNDIKPKTTNGPADVLSYRLSLSDGNRQKTLSVNDVTAPVSIRPLIALLRKLALEQKSRKNH